MSTYSHPLQPIHINRITLAEHEIPLDSQARYSAKAGWWDSIVFGSELVRLMQDKGLFKLNENVQRLVSLSEARK